MKQRFYCNGSHVALRIGVIVSVCILFGVCGIWLAKHFPPDASLDPSEEKTLLSVWYHKDDQVIFDAMIEGAKPLIDSGIQINTRVFASEEALAKEIDESGMPDLLLIQSRERDRILDGRKLMMEGKIYPLDLFLTIEKSSGEFQSSDYFPGVMDVGVIESQQMLLPLTIHIPFVIGEKDSIEAYRKDPMDGNAVFRGRVGGPGALLENWLISSGALWIDLESGQPRIDEEKIEQAIRILRHVYENTQAFYQNYPNGQISFTEWQDAGMMVIDGSNAPSSIRYFESAYQELGDGSKIDFESAVLSDSLLAEVDSVALVGAGTGHEKEAYLLGRALMDLPPENWIAGKMDSPMMAITSVNRTNYLALLGYLEYADMSFYRWDQKTTFHRLPLSEESSEKLQQFTRQIDRCYLPDSKLQDLLEEAFSGFVMGETDDFSSCVDVLLNGLVRLYEGR